MANLTIGYVTCPFSGEVNCEVRRTIAKKAKLYYVSAMGMITPNLPCGQAWMKKHTKFINGNETPLPAVNESEKHKITPESDTLKPVNEIQPVNEKKSLLDMLINPE